MSNLNTPHHSIYNQIRANLLDRYSTGFPVIKELLQNAEDANAGIVRFIGTEGCTRAKNPLLRVPGLLVVNDGNFNERDAEGILSFGASVKADDYSAIGRFGLGQKSVFHLCDAFIAHSFGDRHPFSEVVNPCFGLIQDAQANTWDKIEESDLAWLRNLIPDLPDGFLIWVPLRRAAILPAPHLSFTEVYPSLTDIAKEIGDHASDIRLVLAGLRHVDRIEFVQSGQEHLILHRETDSTKMLGPNEGGEAFSRLFKGTLIDQENGRSTYVGVETHSAHGIFEDLAGSEDWPRAPVFTKNGREVIPEKASAHGAVILTTSHTLRDIDDRSSTFDWGVFLPISRALAFPYAARQVKGLLHGYFFVDSGRQSIEGFGADAQGNGIRARWNRALRDEVLLPLIPQLLSESHRAEILTSEELRNVIASLKDSQFWLQHRPALTAQYGFAQVLQRGPNGAATSWETIAPEAKLRTLPAPNERGIVSTVNLFADLTDWANATGLTLVAGAETALTRCLPPWEPRELARLMADLPADTFINKSKALALAEFLDAADVRNDSERSRAAANSVILALRAALLSKSSLVSEELLRRISGHMPANTMIGLPAAASTRSVLGALANALAEPNASVPPLCVSIGWLPESSASSEISIPDCVSYLETLQSVIQAPPMNDDALQAVLALFRLLRKPFAELREHARLIDLPAIRVYEGSRVARVVSLRDLASASVEQRLFKMSPDVWTAVGTLQAAIPEAAALVVNSSAAELLEQIGIPPLSTQQIKPVITSIAASATTFGSAASRIKLLRRVFSESREARPGLRSLAAGRPHASRETCVLLALPPEFERFEECLKRLLDDSVAHCLIETTISSDLTLQQKRLLGIRDLDGSHLGALLTELVERLPSCELDVTTVEELLASSIPDASLRDLPIFLDRTGVRRKATSLRFESPDWLVPSRMEKLVHVVEFPIASAHRNRLKRLVLEWSPQEQITVALDQPNPEHFALDVLAALVVEGSLAQPIIERLTNTPWLTDSTGKPRKPLELLDLPDEVRAAARRFLDINDQSQYVDSTSLEASIRKHTGFSQLQQLGVAPDRERSLLHLLSIINSARPVAFLGEPTHELAHTLKILAEAAVTLAGEGWPLLAVLLRDSRLDPVQVLRCFSPMTAQDVDEAIAWQDSLSELVQRNVRGAWDAYRTGFHEIWRWNFDPRSAVLREAKIRTADDSWRPGTEIAALGSGVVASHLLHEELRGVFSSLPAPDYSTTPHGNADGVGVKDGPAQDDLQHQLLRGVQAFLEYTTPHEVPPKLQLLVVGILTQSDSAKELVRGILRIQDEAIKLIWRRLEREFRFECGNNLGLPPPSVPRKNTVVILKPLSDQQDSVLVENLCGRLVSFPTGDLEPLQILRPPYSWHAVSGVENTTFMEQIDLPIAAPTSQTVQSIHVKNLFLELADGLYGPRKDYPTCFDRLVEFADEVSAEGQIDVSRIRDEIQDQLPRIISELRPSLGTTVRRALEKYHSAIDAHPDNGRLEIVRRGLKAELLKQLEKVTPALDELLIAVRQRIADYGYDPKRVLFELFQNADDACVQDPPADEACFRLEVQDSVIRTVHWGRLVGDLGPEPQRGQREGWHRDLFNMLLMNLSEKREDVTGHFGLGFKSVHLLSKEVRIASGFVNCRVRGGMIPVKWPEGLRLSFKKSVGTRRATIIELEIAPDRTKQAAAAIEAFNSASRWLPVMGKKIRIVEVDEAGGENLPQRQSYYSAKREESEADGVAFVTLEGNKPGHAIALQLGTGVTLYLPIGAEGPVSVEEDTPRLWLLAPLEESLDVGWLMNGENFRVDPGRGRIAGTDEERAHFFAQLGDRLGERLVLLFDLAQDSWETLAHTLRISQEVPKSSFIQNLIDFFRRDLRDPLAKNLHGPKRGLGRLIRERSALPSGLPAPFAPFLSAREVQYKLTGALSDAALLPRLGSWETFQHIGHRSVTSENSQLLRALGFDDPTPYSLRDVIEHEVGPERRIGPQLAERLGTVLSTELEGELSTEERSEIAAYFNQTEFQMADGSWRRAALPPRDAIDSRDEERRTVAFAPDSTLASSNYRGNALALYRFAARNSGFQRTAAEFARWGAITTNKDQQRSLLRYIIDGHQASELARELISKRPLWLPAEPLAFQASDVAEGMSKDHIAQLLSQLYPKENTRRWALSSVYTSPLDSDRHERLSDPAKYLNELYHWWQEHHQDQRALHDKSAYPSEFRPNMLRGKGAVDNPEGWFTFFALGIFRTIGRTQPEQHRNFIANATTAGWWSEMATAQLPSNPRPWVARLEDFARAEAWRIDYPQWRRALADLYVLSRWLQDYVDAFVSMPLLANAEGHVSLADAWRLSMSPYWQRRGLEGAPLSQSLGIGANWMIREALRHKLWPESEAEALYQYAWSPTSRVRDLLGNSLGFGATLDGHMNASPIIYSYVKEYLGNDSNFLGDFDLPLQIRAADGWTTQ